MKLSIVIICWNDVRVILDCIRSVYGAVKDLHYEVIVADNASTDNSVESVRRCFPDVQMVENGANLGFGQGNNAGIDRARGEYTLILNPDTIVHAGALEKLTAFADSHPQAGAIGCRVLNTDGSLQRTVWPLPTLWGAVLEALGVPWLLRSTSPGARWNGRKVQPIGFQAACCLLVRTRLLRQLRGFDPRFSHQLEDADLCRRVWDSGHEVLFCPDAEITHIGGKTRGNYPTKVILEAERNSYRYYQKYYGNAGAVVHRYASLVRLARRYLGLSLLKWRDKNTALDGRLDFCRIGLKWHWRLDPVQFVECGREPDVGCPPLFCWKKPQVLS